MKLQIGDTIRIKLSNTKWYLSHESQMSHYIYGKNKFDSTYDAEMRMWLNLLLDPSITGKVVKINWPDSADENYRVEVLGYQLNLEPRNLEKV